jgi:hypothetical protein
MARRWGCEHLGRAQSLAVRDESRDVRMLDVHRLAIDLANVDRYAAIVN